MLLTPHMHDIPLGVVKQYCCYGYCIDLLRRLANRTGLTDDFTPFTYELHLVGDGQMGEERVENETRRWTGIIGELLGDSADLAVAPITITPERAARVEFTKPFKMVEEAGGAEVTSQLGPLQTGSGSRFANGFRCKCSCINNSLL
ncbi:unnamed protein product [Protopolystoma xenopodis]|uniref:Ionotropic glutamate receptor L-glutamate and glycine-binding domain-containing protein n=1 Tax=Protopolystoma xenopodis TaxID=117903 RepID=A0A3S5FFB8_9PLAT|nr:unnamed protein product [Protopolystoma xenopodis]